MGELYHCQHSVYFQHCDPAGIVFYPRYVEMVNLTVERWFGEALNYPFSLLHAPGEGGVPARKLAVDFRAPSRLGETLDFTLTVEALGRTSATLEVRAQCGEQTRFVAELVIVYVDGQSLTAQPWPERLRLAMNEFCKEPSL